MSTTKIATPRKSLATQIDRLDTVLDGLADAIPAAVADAVRDAVTIAVREAVQLAIAEVLSSPELLSKLQPAPAPTPAPEPVQLESPTPAIIMEPTITERVSTGLQSLSKTAQRAYSAARTFAIQKLDRLSDWSRKQSERLYEWRKRLGSAAALAVGTAALAYLAGPIVGTMLCAASLFGSMILLTATSTH